MRLEGVMVQREPLTLHLPALPPLPLLHCTAVGPLPLLPQQNPHQSNLSPTLLPNCSCPGGPCSGARLSTLYFIINSKFI